MKTDTPLSLILASEIDDPMILEGFMDQALRATDDKGRNALHAACSKGFPLILSDLLRRVPDLKDTGDSSGATPALYACGRKWDDDPL